jgi:glycosyltransferase involved in cell wall biosynthesis
LERAIRSVQSFAQQVVVVDSYSTDRTVEIARAMGATVLQHLWEHNHGRQINWGIDNARIAEGWVLRLDADEYVTTSLAKEITGRLPEIGVHVSGIFLTIQVHFLGRWLRWGGVYPLRVLRLWRNGKAQCETRWMDERMQVLEGSTVHFDCDLVNDNLNYLTWWTAKHNGYARREAAELLNVKHRLATHGGLGSGVSLQEVETKRGLKEGVYSRLPLFFRPAVYFLYRYLFRLGFLDGVPGLVWHVLQGFWYRFLVDANIYEIERKARREKLSVAELIERDWQLK